MTPIISRTCTEIAEDGGYRNSGKAPQLLETFRPLPAYVLLGDPGAGKTTAFESEAAAIEDGHYITARDFLTFEVNSRSEWRGKTLFIDGLDEVRAGKPDMRVPFDEIRRRLDMLGRPRFRLSCREADWLGRNDETSLTAISPDGKVTVLRLNPLTYLDVIGFLQSHPAVDDGERFFWRARQEGVEGMLTNPQSLKMLITVVTDGKVWPRNRLETFEKACREMIKEHNEEHSIADQAISERGLTDPDQFLEAAGWLCALMLISGTAGFARHRSRDNADYPALDRCKYEHSEYLKAALSTKLFKVEPTGDFAPVHRHVAEFLGGRHLCRIICGGHDRVDRSGVPARRIVALLTGDDGTVVTELRGVSAWLAAYCAEARRELIVRDTTGVGLYGDIQGFSRHEKRELLLALKDQVSELENVHHAAPAFAALATPDMESAFREILEDTSREKEHQEFVDFVLCVLGHGVPMPGLSDILFEIVHDENRLLRINRSALVAFTRSCTGSDDQTSKLKNLLEDIEKGSIPDSQNEMLGTVLSQLYPQEIPPSKIWDYMLESRRHVDGGTYERFWLRDLLERSSDDQAVELLDGLTDRLPSLYRAIRSRRVGDLLVTLLSRGLSTHGDSMDSKQLYEWLGVGCPDPSYLLFITSNASTDIRAWLEQRPEVCKALILEGLNRCPSSRFFWFSAFNVEKERLYHAAMPADYGLWCMRQAAKLVDAKKPQVAEFLWQRAIHAHSNQRNNEGLSLELLKRQARKSETFKARLDKWLNPQPPIRLEFSEKYNDNANKRQQKEKQRLDHIRANEIALYENRAAPELLYRMAQIYFGHFLIYNSESRRKSVERFLNNDPDLTEAVLMGFRGTIDRDDVPNMDEILQLHEENRRVYLGLPFLAGLAEMERTSSEDATLQGDDHVHKALAFYFTTHHGGYRPGWFQRLLADRPETVADVYIRFARSELRRVRKGSEEMQQLTKILENAEVARLASLTLLNAFPTRCRSTQIETLEHSLRAAARYADPSSLQSLVEKKLSLTSMNVAQHARWLAAGLIVSPGKYNDSVERFLHNRRGRVSRIRSLMHMFFSAFKQLHFSGMAISELKILIQLVGRYAEPDANFGTDESGEDGESEGESISYAIDASFYVSEMIKHLAAFPDREATDALKALLADDTLSDWRDMLKSRLDTQRRIRRDASYRHLSIEQICQTLKGGIPANAGDLAALVVDRLSELANTIRDGNTDDWRQYWNEDTHGRPLEPKHEDSCRDTLLSDLRQRLPEGVDTQPEGQYANDKRADIRIAFSNFQVPVEVKKNSHRELWSAMHKQLIRQYVRDPATDGYGIYLVFWFGEEYTQGAPSGKRPDSPQELHERLTATLSPDEARKISVCVIDVSSTESL